MIDILNLSIEQLQTQLLDKNISKFKAKIIYDWIYKKRVYSFNDMSNLSKKDRIFLNSNYYVGILQIRDSMESKDGTIKFLLQLKDNQLIETVVMEYTYGHSICISSQVGCKMGCEFCASSKLGFFRDLTAGEMIAQIITVNQFLDKNIDRVVIMGIGEPFDNFNNLVLFLQVANDHNGLNIGGRKLSVSTCGIVPKIYEFADLKLQVNLSISLHEVSDLNRSKIMPINNKYSISEVLEACKYYINKTNRRISFEYALIGGENDSNEHAVKLAKMLNGMLCYVNVIPINKIKDSNLNYSKKKNLEGFCGILRKNGINVTVRRELGSDINASCGQLRRSYIDGV